VTTDSEPTRRGRLGGGLGLLSLAALAAAFVWVHHWGVRSEAIVTVWALATIGALGVSRWSLRTSEEARGWASLGIAAVVVSLLALAVAGIASAAGTSVTGPCGGG
jgi:hypothetical protein